jgi:hypothetical protein
MRNKERKAHPFNQKKKHGSLTRGRQKRKDAPVPESKVISLDERAKDEQRPFLERLLQEGAMKLLQVTGSDRERSDRLYPIPQGSTG